MRKELKARIKAPRGDLRNQNSGRPDAPLTGCASLHTLDLTFNDYFLYGDLRR